MSGETPTLEGHKLLLLMLLLLMGCSTDQFASILAVL